ncbi:MAG: glycosyltransferase family 39 protein [Anaerolineaceae bacterium]|nr:glycosyltransferase family 39 protein [Anaerolineaceae bacterium]
MTGSQPKRKKEKAEPRQDKNQETTIDVGRSRVYIRADVPEGTSLQINIESFSDGEVAVESQTFTKNAHPKTSIYAQEVYFSNEIPTQPPAGERAKGSRAVPTLLFKPGTRLFRQAIRRSGNVFAKFGWENALFGLALLAYLLSRLIAISDFPIYFFTDEAVQTVLAADLVQDGFNSPDGEFLPTYFYNSYQYNLSLSVYLQVLPYLLFGKSIAVTRGVSALVTVLGALCVGLTMRKVLKLPYAWTAVLLLSIPPAWFLHSRTAFETSLGTTFFAVFIYFYLMYRTASPRYLYAAVAGGALIFYSYSPIRLVIGLTAILLLLSDWGYHWQNRRTVLRGLGLTALLTLPFLRFQFQHSASGFDHLRVLNSYWIQSLPLSEKLGRFLSEYLRGLNPFYWFFPNKVDLSRHILKGYGHILWLTIPFMLTGLLFSLRNIRKPEYRTILLAILASPSGAALVALGITRAMNMVIPIALLSGVGLSLLLQWLNKRWNSNKYILALIAFLLLLGTNVFMTWDAITRGPLWYDDYGLGGMQSGAKQLFAEIAAYKAEYPATQIILSPSWANGTDTIARFFFDDPMPFHMGSIVGHINERLPLDEDTLFIMIPQEYEMIQESAKFTDITLERILPHPNGEPGFYFVRLKYASNIDEILEAEQAERRILQEDAIVVNDEPLYLKYSYLDMGTIGNLFDGDQETLVRTMEANPLVVEISFSQAHMISFISVRVGGTATETIIDMIDDSTNKTITYSKTVENNPTPRNVDFHLGEPHRVTSIRIQVNSIHDNEPAHVHLWEIEYSE